MRNEPTLSVPTAHRAQAVPPPLLVILAGVVAAKHIGKMPPAIPALRAALGVTLLEAGFLLSMAQLAGMWVGVLVGGLTDGLGLRRSLLLGLGVLASASLLGTWAGCSSARPPGSFLAPRWWPGWPSAWAAGT